MRIPPLIAALLFSASAFAQQASVPTLRTDVRLATVDVIVTDKKGVAVRGLKAEGFSVNENKQPQNIRNFEEHAGNTFATYDSPRPGVFTNATAIRGTVSNVLLVDFLNSPAEDQQYMRDQLVKFVASQPTGARTAIFAMNSSVHLLQDFTSDPEILKATLKKMGTQFSHFTGSITTAPGSQMEMLQSINAGSTGALQEQMSQLMQALSDYDMREQAFFTRNKTLMTMSCLRDVARYLSGVNGRKNLLWVSGSFPTFFMQDPESTGKPFQVNEVLDVELRELQNAMSTAQIALYSVDPRGVPVPPSSQPNTDDYYTDLGARRAVNRSIAPMPQNKALDNAQFQEHTSMQELADATGGKAFFNTNDITSALREAQADGSQYYTLTYTPPADARPGQFRNIEVAVKGKGLRVRYRKGYFAPQAHRDGLATLNTEKTSFNMQAMAPQSSEVLFQVEISKPVATTATAKVIGGPVFESQPHTTYQLNAVVDFSTLQFSPEADGKMHGVVDFFAVLYDKNGKVLDSHNDRANLMLDDARYQAMLKSGIHYHQIIAIPDNGDGYVRMAVHDAMTDKLGTVRISMADLRATTTKQQQ